MSYEKRLNSRDKTNLTVHNTFFIAIHDIKSESIRRQTAKAGFKLMTPDFVCYVLNQPSYGVKLSITAQG